MFNPSVNCLLLLCYCGFHAICVLLLGDTLVCRIAVKLCGETVWCVVQLPAVRVEHVQ
jgi:hypothetical protein